MEREQGLEDLHHFHRIHPSSENDLYQSVTFLGQGGFGSVEEVHPSANPEIRYARKRLKQNHILQSRRLEVVQEVIKEAKIIQNTNTITSSSLLRHISGEIKFTLS